MKYILCFLLVLGLTFSPIWASDLHEVDSDVAIISNSDLGIKLQVELKNNGSLAQISFTKGGETYIVPDSLIVDSGKMISLSRIRVLVLRADPESRSEESPLYRIFFACGASVINESKHYAFNSRDEVWFDFVSSSFASRGRCVSMGDLTGKWNLYSKERDENEVKVETVDSVVNPFGSSIISKIE
ncbi:hypothetical protein JIN85_06290 [Luteolibacter pohnpeiensis]|uniref:Pili assembly chaperone N-terminal domain-containing protein n=1 Tax=Luteolibacter pohnpeiensis TaxID=454153 RepID=A0A934S738_9BACT|nr:hypothetical protein [Luteolibacter pohnpeiensis]MBK1882016.1 hypothetical protein [Luteolibacter pohnpeiensis]